MTLLAYSRPFWPLFLHVLGTMVLFGALLTAFVAALARLPRATFASLLIALPAWVVALAAAWWWRSSGKAVAGRAAAALSGIYLLRLTIARLAMSGKWS